MGRALRRPGSRALFGGGSATSPHNAQATPPALAVGGRIVTILVLVGGGLYAQKARHGPVRKVAGRRGAGDRGLASQRRERHLPFSVGLLATALAPGMFCALLLMYPSGRLRSPVDRPFRGVRGTFALCWIALAETGTCRRSRCR